MFLHASSSSILLLCCRYGASSVPARFFDGLPDARPLDPADDWFNDRSSSSSGSKSGSKSGGGGSSLAAARRLRALRLEPALLEKAVVVIWTLAEVNTTTPLISSSSICAPLMLFKCTLNLFQPVITFACHFALFFISSSLSLYFSSKLLQTPFSFSFYSMGESYFYF